MWLQLISLLTIVLLSLIGPSFSATFVNLLDEETQFETYNRLRDKNVYRGVLLALSSDDKNEMCQDAFSAQLYVSPEADKGKAAIRRLVRDSSKITSELEEAQHNLMVRRLTFEGTPELRQDLTFRCVGHFTTRNPELETSFYVSSGYQPKWLYSNFDLNPRNREKLAVMNYILLSPDSGGEQAQLEKRYVDVLHTINDLEKESPRYVKQLENRHILTTLSRTQKQILCASIVSSPVYRAERLEFFAIWLYGTRGGFEIEEKQVSYKKPDGTIGTLPVRCVRCKAVENYETDASSPSTDLYLASSYDDENSLVVLKKREDGIFFDKYFRNIPLFIAAQEDMNYGHLFLNYVYAY